MTHDDSVTKAYLKCGTCEKEFPKLSLLKSHEMVHTGQRPYACKGMYNASNINNDFLVGNFDFT